MRKTLYKVSYVTKVEDKDFVPNAFDIYVVADSYTEAEKVALAQKNCAKVLSLCDKGEVLVVIEGDSA